jgi:peptide/nickel transport system substrate-binding protein
MRIFFEIKRRLAAILADWRIRQRIDSIDRSDVLLAHRVVARRKLPGARQWRLVGRVLAPGERRFLRWAIASLFIGAILIVASWAVTHSAFVPASGGEYREGVVGSPHAPNPILAGNNDIDQDIVHLVYSGLYRRDGDGRLALDLAQSADVSADGKTYTFTLRNGAMFHDGAPVTADDVVFTVQAIQNPAWKSPLAPSLKGVIAKAADSRTVMFSVNLPSSYLPSFLTFGILPKRIWADVDPASRAVTDFNLKPIGSGPFRFEKFTHDQQGNILTYTLRRAKDSPAQLERITFKFFDDYDTAVDKLTSNSVDGLNFVPPGKLASVKTIPGIAVHVPNLEQYTAVFLNPRSDSSLADAAVRQALSYAIDRQKIVDSALGGLGLLRDQPLPDEATGGATSAIRYTYDPTKAGALLDQAGYVLPPDTHTRAKTVTTPAKTKKEQPTAVSTELNLTLATIDTDENRRAAEIIKEGWDAIGVKTEIVLADAQDIQKSIIRPRAYDALLFGEILGPDSDPYPFWHSSQIDGGLNLSAYSNRRVDELLEKARLAPSVAERQPLLAEFEEILTKDEPAIFLYEPDYLYPQSDKLHGFAVSSVAAPADRFANVTDWYRKFKLTFK